MCIGAQHVFNIDRAVFCFDFISSYQLFGCENIFVAHNILFSFLGNIFISEMNYILSFCMGGKFEFLETF